MGANDPHLNTGKYSPQSYWNARARTSEGNVHQAVCAFRHSDDLNLAAERVQRFFLKRVFSKVDLQGAEVLEIGCGVARWLDLVEFYGARYAGVDISNEMIELAKARRPDGRFTHITGPKLPYPDNSLDLVFSVTVLHHNSFEQQELILKEADRILKDGGHLLLMEDIVHDQTQQLSFNMFPRTYEDWVAAVTDSGRIRVVSSDFARWWFSADRAERALRRLRNAVGRREDAPVSRFGSWIVRAANALDILLQRVLPRRWAVNAVILFEKSGPAERGNGA